MANHYIRIDLLHDVVDAFSDEFCVPGRYDKLVAENASRQFHLDLFTIDGKTRYVWDIEERIYRLKTNAELSKVRTQICVMREGEFALIDDVRGDWYRTNNKEKVTLYSINDDTTGLTRLIPRQFDKWNPVTQKWEFDMVYGCTVRLAEVKANAYKIITDRYPIWKQIDITLLVGCTQAEKDEMIAFIQNIREQCAAFETMLSHLTIDAFGDFQFSYDIPEA